MMLLIVLLPLRAAAQTPHVVIVVGLSGDAEHAELFKKWGDTLAAAAVSKLGVSRDHLAYLADQPVEDKRVTGRSTREEVVRALHAVASSAGADDPVMIVLIGHGTFDGRAAKFNLRGPDMTAEEFAPLLDKIRSKRLVFVNTASASGPFVEALSGEGRTIITATRTGAERFATLFGGFFVDAIATDAADADRNGRVSMLEAFAYSTRAVTDAYAREGLMMTEHALLDDNGDKEGSTEPSIDAKDGRVASVIALGSATAAVPADANPRLRALYAERQALEHRVESLKLLKGSMDPARYASQLEQLLTDLALKSREIREAEGKSR
ncbi:MAG TPA: C13 family peptidase [Vicinamibacterales bacterium]|nr:C13 family peptidase [Vicinamibacterales bacterium]